MARANFRPIKIPEKVEVKVENKIVVKGPLGTLNIPIFDDFNVVVRDREIYIEKRKEKYNKAMLGLLKALINNATHGVTRGFEKTLLLWGIGYRIEEINKGVKFFIGYSHPVDFILPEGIKAVIEKPPRGSDKNLISIIKISGIDKQLVGETAARMRKIRLPDSYKGKGIRYVDEKIKLKPGKGSVA